MACSCSKGAAFYIYKSNSDANMTLSLLLLLACFFILSATAFQCQIKSQIRRGLDHQLSTLFASNGYGADDRGGIQQVLKQFGFAGRLVTLHNHDLSEKPLPAELYDKGTWKLCLVKGLKLPSSSKADDAKPPLLQVLMMDDDGLFTENKVVDVGSLTFLWSDFYQSFQISTTTDELVKTLECKYKEAIKSLQSDILTTEDAMQNLYNGRIANRSRLPANNRHRQPLTKKQIPKIAAKFPQFNHLEELLRNLVKVGEDRSSRMVDSVLAMDYLYKDFCREGDNEQLIRRVIAATVLTSDATSGGRFKRRSCQFVECSSILEDGVCESATFVNGGWIAQDPSVRAGTEGRKFAAATKQPKDVTKSTPLMTAADERIAHRLECLAMGDVWKNDNSDHDEEENSLELDVREALSSMNLPLTADGATRALIQLGRWSQNDAENKNKKTKIIEPWSAEVIDAAQKLVRYRERRQVEIDSARKKSKKGKTYNIVDGRVDLSSLPCVCVDAKRATFRDDSIGIRLRSSTGRKATTASKWEVLIHIADVSNIYLDGQFTKLREAAERRGQSRYDLPFGPLHLLPPKALSAIALSTDDNSSNECVTVWAYIDEEDGKLIEAGLERTIIGSPKALSFDDATNLLEIDSQSVHKSRTNTKAIISIAERNLSLWSQRRQERSEAAQKREKRLATKELISRELSAAGNVARDDGVGGSFQRSRGHRLVDSSLDLYAVAITALMKQKKKPMPRAAGSGADRGGRLGTAPLRRYIDGMCQRQTIAVLCGHGKPLSLDECKEASKIASRASDAVANLRSTKKRDGSTNNNQRGALHKVARHISSTGARKLKAVSSGHNNEVVILGTGAVARCRGVKGTLKGGEKLLIEVITIDPERGLLDVRLTS